MTARGVVAAGHRLTVQAAEEVLKSGGNAFDAAVAAQFAACVAEPVLASLGGGGFLLAAPCAERPVLYDFFVQTPIAKSDGRPLGFRPVVVDFGTAKQEFHIGSGTIATPGVVKGMFEVHRALCTLPMRELVAPACRFAREGVVFEPLQSYIFSIVSPIYTANPDVRSLFTSPADPARLVSAGECLRFPDLADTLEALADEGEDLFYRGDIGRAIEQQCRDEGGLITRHDLSEYAVLRRRPLEVAYRSARVVTNPPPSSGGILLAFALELLNDASVTGEGFGTCSYLRGLAEVMALTSEARLESLDLDALHGDDSAMLSSGYLRRYREILRHRARSFRGTTHISVIDARGNLASLTVSNGEGSGYVVPGSGIMLNNMLGEEDLNPGGFHRWRANQRMTSMMSPTMVRFSDGTRVAMGSGGSNRIRSALLQVLVNLIDFGAGIQEAVDRPRIHLEGQTLNVEGGFDPDVIDVLASQFARCVRWTERNLFFGGVHSVCDGPKGLGGSGDPRRGGCVRLAQ